MIKDRYKSMTEKYSDIVLTAPKLINEWSDYWNENAIRGEEDVRFADGDQYDYADIADYKFLKKPMMTVNVLRDHVNKVMQEFIRNYPTFSVVGKDLVQEGNEEDLKNQQKKINALENIIDSIVNSTDSKEAYRTMTRNAIKRGYGVIELGTEYEDAYSCNQIIKIYQNNYPENCFFDPRSEHITKKDGEYCGKYFIMNKDSFEKEYGKYEHSFDSSFSSSFSNQPVFVDLKENEIVLVEFYLKEYFHFKLVQLEEGSCLTKKQYTKLLEKYEQFDASLIYSEQDISLFIDEFKEYLSKEFLEKLAISLISGMKIQFPEIVSERKTKDYKIYRYLLTKDSVIERTEWPSKTFGLLFMPGHFEYINGRQQVYSFIHAARDSQKFLNYNCSEIAQSIKLRNRADWMATPGNINGHENDWRFPENKFGVKYYNPDPITGAPPIKNQPSEISQSLFVQYERSLNDIQTVLGRYDSSSGAQGNEISGSAIDSRIRQAQAGTYNIHDNALVVMESLFDCILQIIPKIYDSERSIYVSNRFGETSVLSVNGPGQVDLTKGKFGIKVTVKENYELERLKNIDQLIKFAELPPEVISQYGDLIAQLFSTPNKDEIINRVRMNLDPRIKAMDEGKEMPQQQPDPQQIMAQQQLQLQKQSIQLQQESLELERARLQVEKMNISEKQKASILKYLADQTKAEAEIIKARTDMQSEYVKAAERSKERAESFGQRFLNTMR